MFNLSVQISINNELEPNDSERRAPMSEVSDVFADNGWVVGHPTFGDTRLVSE